MDNRAKRDDLVFLEDILECIKKINEYIEGVSRQDFEANDEKQDAVIRRLEIIGEAVKNISTTIRNQNSTIPWREMAGMRDVVVHQYFGVSIGLIWKVCTVDIPNLELPIKRLIEEKLLQNGTSANE
ncbi:DUF86 domain-containing protein [Aequorivita todarodis]|uniref:HepT-like ribonuclease domain-containing protein n=1 Tax=Aequorivita todarodis TaxID=2036821 RepID=UPI002350B1A2|nr:DUF86 domain-containing protein [Aequorivita todarodis]MDC8001907.1 DUF86 domain-containing protein [Aequorivita todarodis]